MVKMSNSPFISFVRSLAMIAILITILLIAVFWNGLPSLKNEGHLLPVSWNSFFQQDEEEPAREPRREISAVAKQTKEKKSDVSASSISLGTEASHDISLEPQQVVLSPLPAPSAPPVAMEAELPEDFTALKRTLEQKHDVTDIHLERWGSSGKMYRFSCYVSEPKGSGVKKLHQSIQPTPTLAIQKVMETIR